MSFLNINELCKLNYLESGLQKAIESITKKIDENFCDDKIYRHDHDDEIKGVYKQFLDVFRMVQMMNESKEEADRTILLKQISNMKGDISDNKEKLLINIEELKLLESSQRKEMIYYHEKLGQWSQNIVVDLELSSKSENKRKNKIQEVNNFFDFIYSNGGYENGWNKNDHAVFLKLRAKSKDADELAARLQDILPDISIEEIGKHEQWYKKYEELLSKKKEAILKWKNSNISKTKENYYFDKTEAKTKSKSKISEEELVAMKQKLKEWKNIKQQKMEQQNKQEKQKIKRTIEKHFQEKQRQLELKKIVSEWKESKKMLEEVERINKQATEKTEGMKRSRDANKMIKQFQSMDELYILKMRKNREKNKESSWPRQRSAPCVERDPLRLFKPTKQWIHRVKAHREDDICPVYILKAPKLGIPDWRKTAI